MEQPENLSTSIPTIDPQIESPAPKALKVKPREVFKMVSVGKPGTGKTTQIRKLVRRALEARRRVLVVTPHENEWLDLPLVHPRFPGRIATYVGGRRVICRELEQCREVCRLFRNGLLVFDDCRVYIPDAPDPEIRAMLISCRQNDVDLVAVGHGFTTVPPILFTYATHFMIFATTDNVARRKNVVLNFPALEAAVAEVNREALEKPHTFKIVKNE